MGCVFAEALFFGEMRAMRRARFGPLRGSVRAARRRAAPARHRARIGWRWALICQPRSTHDARENGVVGVEGSLNAASHGGHVGGRQGRGGHRLIGGETRQQQRFCSAQAARRSTPQGAATIARGWGRSTRLDENWTWAAIRPPASQIGVGTAGALPPLTASRGNGRTLDLAALGTPASVGL